MSKKVNCAFNRWSMKFDKFGGLVVKFEQFPIDGKIVLQDFSVEELKLLSDMFLEQHRKMQE